MECSSMVALDTRPTPASSCPLSDTEEWTGVRRRRRGEEERERRLWRRSAIGVGEEWEEGWRREDVERRGRKSGLKEV